MRSAILALGVASVGVLIAIAAAGQSTRPERARDRENRRDRDAGDPERLIARGEYITHHVAMCIQCHTPRTASNAIDPRRKFHGAPMPVKSPFANQEWAFQTPHIAGLPGWTVEEAVFFLMEGKDPRGREPLPPMPPFRMNREDATAVVAYLMSIK